MRTNAGQGTRTRLLAVLASAVCLLAPAAAAAETDLVLLLDVSTSMRGLFPEAREQVYKEIDQAVVGDRVVVITFGEGVHLHARRRIRGAADRAYLRAVVQSLQPTQRATYLTRGLDRGFSELLALFETAPDRKRRLIWLSDDKNNPPASLGESVFTLADLREQNAEFEPEGEWFTLDAPIGGEMTSELSEFLEWARRTLFRLQVRETGVALGTLDTPETEVQTTLHFTPQHAALAGLEFAVIARVSDPETPGAPHHDVVVEPSVITVRAEEWAQTFTLRHPGPPGAYSGFLVFESYARTNFRVEPERIPLSFTAAAPVLLAETPAPEVKPQTLTEMAATMLESAERAPGAERAARPLTFGPVEPGQTYRNVIRVTTNAPVDRRDLRLQTEFELPEGFALTAEFRGEDQLFNASLNLKISSTAQISQLALQGGAIEGRITFAAADPRITVTPLFRRVLFRLDPRSTRWGRRLLPEDAGIGRTAAERLSFEELGALQDAVGQAPPQESNVGQLLARVRPIVQSPVVWGGLGLAAILGYLVVRFRPRRSVFFGELVTIKDPNPRKMRNVNLRRVATQRGHDTLTVGSGARSDVRLAHESVNELHARIVAIPVGEDTVMAMQATRGAEVKINDQVRTERVRLKDKDLIAIGSFIFLFSSPEPERRVVVRFQDGSVLRGTPLQWDLTANSFQLLLDEPTADEEIAHVDFADLKAVFFVQEQGAGRRSDAVAADRLMEEFELEVEFSDGEKLEGYALTDYTEQARRFYLVPKDDPSVVSVLIERANAKAVLEQPRTDRPRARGSWVRRLFARS